MSYPDIRLTRGIRIAIMMTLVLAFFIISPLLLLYTAGYRYDFEEHRILETGVMSIDIEPEDAQVYLNGVHIEKKMPLRLTNRAPGVYTVNIHRDGHHSFEQQVEVQSKQTTYIRDILLPKIEHPVQQVDDATDMVAVYPQPNGKFTLLVAQQGQVFEVVLLNTQTDEEEIVIRDISPIAPRITWSPYNDHAAILFEAPRETQIHLLSARDTAKLASHTIALPAEQAPLQWLDKNSPQVYFQDDDAVFLLSDKKERIGSVSSSVWFVHDDTLWATTQEAHILSAARKQSSELFELPASLQRIIDINNNRLIVQGLDGNIHILSRDNDELVVKQDISAQRAVLHAKRNEWIVWSDNEITKIFADGGSELIERTSDRIHTILPIDDFDTVLLVTDNALLYFNIFHFTKNTLVSDIAIEHIGSDQKEQQIYFWASKHGEQPSFYSLTY